MDLRKYLRSDEQVRQASQLLNYQPYVLSDELQTGVAHSWLYRDEGGRNSWASHWLCDRRLVPREVWNQFADANGRLRNMYEDWINVIVQHFPTGSLVDVGCNSGYFPLRAQQLGMRECTGYDQAEYGSAVDFLNKLLGTRVQFYQQGYDVYKHFIPGCKVHDVAVASLLICHLPDPLHFLACLGRIARKGVFLFTGMAESDDFTIHYNYPNKFYKDRVFPYNFDNDTGLSRGLLFKSMEWMGFTKVVEIPYRETWLPRQWFSTQKARLFLR